MPLWTTGFSKGKSGLEEEDCMANAGEDASPNPAS